MNEVTTKKTGAIEMLSFGGAQFAKSIYMAFSSYYLMAFCTDIVLIPSAVTAVLLFCFKLFSALDIQAIGIFINRMTFKDGKYRPYYKWCALPYAISLAALGLTPDVSITGRVAYFALVLILCDLIWSVLHTASMSMLPYLARDDVSRTKFISFSNGSSILDFIIVGTFMLPMVDIIGGGDKRRGFTLALALLAVISAPLLFNAYFRLKEKHYSPTAGKPAIKDVFLAIGRNRRIVLFLAGFCLYCMADAFKNLTTYYYMSHVMKRPDLLPVVISAGLLSPLAVQPVIPRLLKYAKKETLIVCGLFAASCACLLMLAAGTVPFLLIICVVLYGIFTAVVANLVYTVMASFTDEMLVRQNISMSEILTAAMNLSSNIGAAVSSGAAALVMAAAGYAAQASTQPDSVLGSIKALYIFSTAAGMVLAGVVMLMFHMKHRRLGLLSQVNAERGSQSS
jgi:GPH family glycoside/pentoside/hexuronide:cation symporter